MSIERIRERLALIGRMKGTNPDITPAFSDQDVLLLIAEIDRHQGLYDHMKSVRETYGYESWTEVLTVAERLKAEVSGLAEIKVYATISLRERCAERLQIKAEKEAACALLKRFVDGEHDQEEDQAERYHYHCEAQLLLAKIGGEYSDYALVPEHALKAQADEIQLLRKHAPSSEIIWCACGDGYPANSYGAGFMDANGGVCENCDAAQPKISCPIDLFESLRDSAAEEADQHRQCMGSYRPSRQEVLDAVVRQCDELIAGASKVASNG